MVDCRKILVGSILENAKIIHSVLDYCEFEDKHRRQAYIDHMSVFPSSGVGTSNAPVSDILGKQNVNNNHLLFYLEIGN